MQNTQNILNKNKEDMERNKGQEYMFRRHRNVVIITGILLALMTGYTVWNNIQKAKTSQPKVAPTVTKPKEIHQEEQKETVDITPVSKDTPVKVVATKRTGETPQARPNAIVTFDKPVSPDLFKLDWYPKNVELYLSTFKFSGNRDLWVLVKAKQGNMWKFGTKYRIIIDNAPGVHVLDKPIEFYFIYDPPPNLVPPVD